MRAERSLWNRIKWALFGDLLLWRIKREFYKNVERKALEDDLPRLTDAEERKLIEAELWGRNW